MRLLTLVLAAAVCLPSALAEDSAGGSRGFRVRLSSDGLLPTMFSGRDAKTGHVGPVEDVRVKLIRKGRIVASSSEVIDGVVQLKDVEPGTYSLIATAPEGYVSAGLQVLPAATFEEVEEADADQKGDLLSAGVHVFLVDRADYRAVAGFYRGVGAPAAQQDAASGKIAENAFGDGILSPFRKPTLSIQENGRAVGRIVGLDPRSGRDAAVASARLAVIRDGRIISAAVTDGEGRYELTGLQPGRYTLATASDRGFSAFGVEARVAEKTAAAKTASPDADAEGRRFVQFGGEVVVDGGFGAPIADGTIIDGGYSDPCCCVEHAVICEDAIPYEPLCGDVISETILSEPFIDAPLAEAPLGAPLPLGGGGGFGGGFGGGGGGFGGGFGALGAAAGLAGLGLGVAALADDDDDNAGGNAGGGGTPVSPGGSQSEED